jgi:hypothetical protein
LLFIPFDHDDSPDEGREKAGSATGFVNGGSRLAGFDLLVTAPGGGEKTAVMNARARHTETSACLRRMVPGRDFPIMPVFAGVAAAPAFST